ncbi:hypothetical protein [Fischerella thermalis]
MSPGVDALIGFKVEYPQGGEVQFFKVSRESSAIAHCYREMKFTTKAG